MNCIADDRSTYTEELLSPYEATSFISTIQALPSAESRFYDTVSSKDALLDTRSIVSGPYDEDETPQNICQDVWGTHDYNSGQVVSDKFTCAFDIEDADTADPSLVHVNSFQSTMSNSQSFEQQANDGGSLLDVSYHSRVSSYKSGCKEEESPKTRGLGDLELKKEGSGVVLFGSSRVSSYGSGCSVSTEMYDEFERGRLEGSPTRQLKTEGSNVMPQEAKAKKGGMLTKTLCRISPFKSKNRSSKNRSNKKYVAIDSIACDDRQKNDAPDDNHAVEQSDSLNLVNNKTGGIINLSSSLSTANETVTTSNTAPTTNKSLNNKKTSIYFTGFKNRRPLVGAAAAAATVPIVAMAGTANDSKSDGNQGKSAETPKDQAGRSPFAASIENSLPVHLMSISQEDTPMKYDEICYGSCSPSELVTPAHPMPVDYMPQGNSIVKTDVKLPKDTTLKEMSRLSPIATNDSVELDATGSLTMTPESTDYLSLSKGSEGSISDRCRSFLSDVSRALFLKGEPTIGDEDIRFNGMGDDDVFECTLNNDTGVFDVTVNGGAGLSWADYVSVPSCDIEISTADKAQSTAKLGWIKSLRSRSSRLSL